MALPAHLAHLDRLVQLVTDVLVREFEEETETTTPATSAKGAGVRSNTRTTDNAKAYGKRPRGSTARP